MSASLETLCGCQPPASTKGSSSPPCESQASAHPFATQDADASIRAHRRPCLGYMATAPLTCSLLAAHEHGPDLAHSQSETDLQNEGRGALPPLPRFARPTQIGRPPDFLVGSWHAVVRSPCHPRSLLDRPHISLQGRSQVRQRRPRSRPSRPRLLVRPPCAVPIPVHDRVRGSR
ncbi:hypothetical protein BC628DRAFT_1025162 [Trametes gibbosa]|nr:hypothetical protein BC628DRAFT_1025162 [Trametes gibbosa]